MAGTATVNEGRRSTRPRQSVDYKAPVAPGTPNWLKLGDKPQLDEDNQQGVNKENNRPAPVATKKGRASKVVPVVQNDSSDKSSATDRAHADDAGHSQRDGKQKGEATETAPRSKAERRVQKAEDAPVVTTTRSSKQLPKQRRSAPTSKHEQAGNAHRVSLAPAKPAGKRSLAEQKTEDPGGTKKAKTSQPEQKAEEAAQVTHKEGQAAKSAKPAAKGFKSMASWSSGEDVHPDAEAQPPQEANARSTRMRPTHQDTPAGKTEAPQQLPAKEQPPKKRGSTGSSDAKAAEEAAAKGKAPAPVEQDAELADDPGASASSDFQKLQAEYAVLQKKYQAIKQQRMEELEVLMTEQQQRALEHREAALKLAQHWKEEAIKQARFAQEAGSTQLQKQRKSLQEENQKLQQQLLDAQAAVLQQQAAVADLQHLLAMAERRVVTPVKPQVTPRTGTRAVSPTGLQSQMGASNTPSCISAIRDAYKSCTKAPPSSACPLRTHTPVHLQEAHAMCPEGNDLSETYRKPAHVPGATAGSTVALLSPAGDTGMQVEVPGGSPLVQYSETASVYQPRSRFAAEAAVLIQQEREPEQAGAMEVPILGLAGKEPIPAALPGQDAPLEAAGRLSAEKGASAPAIMTTHSWPELVREVQQLPGPVGEAAKEMLQEGSMAGGQGSTLTQKALDTLVGLRAEPAEQGGYRYMHQSTGYSFEIRPSEGDATPEYEVLMPGQQEMLFVPLQLGHAAQVLPDYLKEEITFSAMHKQKLVGRIMEALGTLSIRQARLGQ